MSKKRIDISGEKYGKLTVIREVAPIVYKCGHLERMWECKCDCGNTVVYSMSNIRSGNSKSCGCSKIIDLTGQKFGRLLVIGKGDYIQKPKRKVYKWICKCDCGKIIQVRQNSLITGATKSCGCIVKDGKYKEIKNHRLRGVWHSMRLRCNNPNNKSYIYYGGRGIAVCPEWNDKDNGYIAFYEWAVNNGYKEGLTIDRINVNGDYGPNNCRWIANDIQQTNKRNNHIIEYNGEVKCIAEWARIYGLRPDTLRYRVKHGWSIEKALKTPVAR